MSIIDFISRCIAAILNRKIDENEQIADEQADRKDRPFGAPEADISLEPADPEFQVFGQICRCEGTMLRWTHSPITWRIDDSVEKQMGEDFVRVLSDSMSQAFKTWKRVGDFKYQKKRSGQANIMVSFRELDGPSGTLGIAWQSGRGDSMTDEEGYLDRIGDIWLDVEEGFPVRKSLLDAVILHEVGHALGMPHVDGAENIMNPFITDNKTPSEEEARLFAERYPIGGNLSV